jgi:SAM-dependent methyltransferase
VERCLALPHEWLIVDLACGSGRLAVPLARAGRSVVAVDFVERAVRTAAEGDAGAVGVVADVWALPFRDGSLGAIVTVNFLERGLFPALIRLLRPGGHLVVETYTVRQLALAERGAARSPTNPAYLLQPGELASLVATLEVVAAREGLVEDEAGVRDVAGVDAVRRGAADRGALAGTGVP